MNWYLQSGKDSDVAKSTRIRFSRNLKGFKFNLKTKQEIEKLENKIEENIFSIGYGLKFLKLKDMDNITKQSLVEKNLISPDFSKNENGSILINDEENICIMIGGEDHLQIQVFNCGLDLRNVLNLAIEIDNKLNEVLGYSMNKKYGYLTASPANVGTGLRASVMVHMPALSKTNNIRKYRRQVVSQSAYEDLRTIRINELVKCGVSREVAEKSIPRVYNGINNEYFRQVINRVVVPMYDSRELQRYYKEYIPIVQIENGKVIVPEVILPERLKEKRVFNEER